VSGVGYKSPEARHGQQQLGVSVPLELLNALSELALANDWSLSETARRLLRRGLEDEGLEPLHGWTDDTED
jgi:hypothetical protein